MRMSLKDRSLFITKRQRHLHKSRARILPESVSQATKPTTLRQPEKRKSKQLEVERYDYFYTYTGCNSISLQAKQKKEFQAGQLKEHTTFWNTFTKDPWVLNSISGLKIQLKSQVFQNSLPKEI